MPGKVNEKKWQRAKEIVAEQKGHTPKGKDYGLVQHIYQGMKKEEESNSEMAEATTTNIERKAKRLKALMDEAKEAPPWVVGKLSQAKTHVQDVMDYVGTDGVKKDSMAKTGSALNHLKSLAKEIFDKSDVPFQLNDNWPGLDKAMKEWAGIKGVHKPATGHEEEGISEAGEKTREAHALTEKYKGKFIEPSEFFGLKHLQQKARIRHEGVLSQIRQMKAPQETPKPKPEEYSTKEAKPESRIAQIQQKWSKVKDKL